MTLVDDSVRRQEQVFVSLRSSPFSSAARTSSAGIRNWPFPALPSDFSPPQEFNVAKLIEFTEFQRDLEGFLRIVTEFKFPGFTDAGDVVDGFDVIEKFAQSWSWSPDPENPLRDRVPLANFKLPTALTDNFQRPVSYCY